MKIVLLIVVGGLLLLFLYNAATHKHHLRKLEQEKMRRQALRKYYMEFPIDTEEWEGDGIWIVSPAVRFVVEVDEEGQVTREIGYDDSGAVAHCYSLYEEPPPNLIGFSRGSSAFDHNILPADRLRDQLTVDDFEIRWKQARAVMAKGVEAGGSSDPR